MNLSLSLSLGSAATQGARARRPSTREVLSLAISELKFVTFTYDGESLTFAPLVIYELDGIAYVDGFLSEDTGNGNRPPALTTLIEADITQAKVTADVFSVHPRLWPILRRYENVKSIVQSVEQTA